MSALSNERIAILATDGFEEQEVVVDRNLVTSQGPQDLPAFTREMVRLFATARPEGSGR